MNPNAPSGASTAAPYFGAWRLVQLMAVRRRKVLIGILAVLRFYLHYLFVCFCRYLLVLDVFHFFESWHTALVVHKFAARKVSNIEPNWCQNPSNSSQIHQKSAKISQNGAQEHSESDPGRRSPPEWLLGGTGLCFFGGFLAPLGRFGAPFWDPVGAKGSKIEHFGTKMLQNVRK